jgi:UPF0176 protein
MTMAYKVAALYQFVALPDFRGLKQPLLSLCERLVLRGTLLLASEGINGTLAGTAQAIDTLVHELRHGDLFGGRLDNLELKFSSAAQMPFGKMKVRLKKEIVTFKDQRADPTRAVGTYVDAAAWNDLVTAPDVVLIDTRNQFEVAMGTFEGAIDPAIARFSEFRDFADRALDPRRHKKIAMFCTGGIRCEKASSYLIARGFPQVYHLKGGILKYLEEIPAERSLWKGECFVFDEREALGHGLVERSKPGQTDGNADG